MSFKSDFRDNIADGKDIHGFDNVKIHFCKGKIEVHKKVRQMKTGQIIVNKIFLFFTV